MPGAGIVGSLVEPLTGRRWEPDEVDRQVRARAQRMRELGLGVGERAVIGYGNRLEFFADLLAIWHLGGVAVPVDARLTAFEIGRLVDAAKPKLFLGNEEPDHPLSSELRSHGLEWTTALEGDPGDRAEPQAGALELDADALILFTSGTTGDPKGVVHTHRSLWARWEALRSSLGVERYRRTLCLLPTHFGHGLICNCLYPWLAGCDLFILPPFSPTVVMRLGSLIDEHSITFLSSVPPVWKLALKAAKPPQGGSLERVFCGSAPLAAHLWREIQSWSGTREVMNSYGITETGSWVAGMTGGEIEPEDGLIGVGWGARIAVMKGSSAQDPPGAGEPCGVGEEGFVWLATPALMRGYLDRPDLTSEVVRDGWFMTGDLGVLDEGGRLYLRGRVREEINKGGTKVHPTDVDAVAERFDDVEDVCSFGFADDLYGQNVGIALVLGRSGDEVIRDLFAWMKRHLAEHQMPIRWYVLDQIPRTSRGKINRERVAAACAELTPVDLHRVLE